MDVFEIDITMVQRAARRAGIDVDYIGAAHLPDVGDEPAWAMRATADQLITFTAELMDEFATGSDRYSAQSVIDLGKHVRIDHTDTDTDTGDMTLVFTDSRLVGGPPVVGENEVLCYRESVSWRLIVGPDIDTRHQFGAVDRDAVLASCALLAIERPGLVIRMQDDNSLTARAARTAARAQN